MPGISLPLRQRSFGKTSRRDRWWVTPVGIFVGLSAFVVYSTWAALQGTHYWVEGTNYLSPFYAPELFGNSPHAWFGAATWVPDWLPYSPALLILWAPAGFRLTCYYYCGAYYKAFWADPPACAVGEPRKGYIGESNWPLRIQNVHRYFMYVAIVFIFLLSWDTIKSFWFPGTASVRLGSLVHGERRPVGRVRSAVTRCGTGGRPARAVSRPRQQAMYRRCSKLNSRHAVLPA